MWFKKKIDISGFNANTAVDGYDWRIFTNSDSWSVSTTSLSAADASNYFYLPPSGYYYSGQLIDVGVQGFYWSSTGVSSNHDAYYLRFSSSNIEVFGFPRSSGYRVAAFE